MSHHEKGREQEDAYKRQRVIHNPIPTSLFCSLLVCVETYTLYLFTLFPQLKHQKLQKSSDNLLVFLSQSQSHCVGVDVEWTNVH